MKFPQCVSYDIKKQVKMVVLYSLRTVLLQRSTSWRRQFTRSEDTSRAAHFCPSPRWPWESNKLLGLPSNLKWKGLGGDRSRGEASPWERWERGENTENQFAFILFSEGEHVVEKQHWRHHLEVVLPGIHGQSIFNWHEQQQKMIETNHWLFVSKTEEVLSKDSAEDLNKGLNPGPMTEIKFWEAKVGFGAKGVFTLIWELVLLDHGLIFLSVHQPGVLVRADEGGHDEEDGVHPERDGQRLLPHLQVHVPQRGRRPQWVPWHHHAPQAPCWTLWGPKKIKKTDMIFVFFPGSWGGRLCRRPSLVCAAHAHGSFLIQIKDKVLL